MVDPADLERCVLCDVWDIPALARAREAGDRYNYTEVQKAVAAFAKEICESDPVGRRHSFRIAPASLRLPRDITGCCQPAGVRCRHHAENMRQGLLSQAVRRLCLGGETT
jgi:hypothetical protein